MKRHMLQPRDQMNLNVALPLTEIMNDNQYQIFPGRKL